MEHTGTEESSQPSHEGGSRRLHEAAWPDMFANLQSAYAELSRAQFELEQRAAEVAETRDLFERVVESMSEALFLLDRAGRVERANAAARALLKYAEAELTGRPFSEVCGTDEIPATPWRVLERAPSGKLADMGVRVRTRDGRSVPCSVSCGLVRDKRGKITGVLAVLRDITERKRAEEALHASEERFSKAFQSSPDPMSIQVLGDGRYIDVNESFLRTTGYAREEVIGRTTTDLHIFASHEDLATVRRRLLEEGAVKNLEISFRMKGGGVRVGLLSAETIELGGERCVLSVTADITERKRAEEERERLLEREQAARAAAEEASRLKDEFLATVSHELRTPLTPILGWARMLRDNALEEDVRSRALETIERSAHAQSQIINDLLDVSRIIAGKLRLDIRHVELAAVVEMAVETVRAAAEAKAIEIRTTFDPSAGVIPGDPNRLQQVVWNLLTNAVKFTPRGGRVEVRLARADSHVELTVSDTGQGITPDFLPYVFDRFRQADGSSTRAHGGLGLGLAIVRHLVELHGGTVGVDSPGEGLGTTFRVRLPQSADHLRASGPERRRAQGVPALDSPPTLEGLHVLAVDDDRDTLELIALALRQNRAEVTTAASAAEALAALERVRPDVLVSDIGMPEADGYELIQRVRALPAARGGQIPAVALTAYARAEDRMRALLSGYQIHVPKPVNPIELLAVVASLAGRTGKV